MGDPAPGKLPGHMQLTDFDISLERGDARYPLRPVVQGLRLRVSERGLQTLAQALVDEADRRAPVGIKLKDVRVGPRGIELSARMTKAIFSSDLSTRLVLSTPDGNELRVELTDTDMPTWVPLEMLLDEAARRGGNGVRRDPGNRSALLIDPAALLARAGVPGRFAPGRWDVTTSADGLELRFRESAGRMIRALRRPRHYYGWTIVWTLAVTETISWGILYYAFAVFLVPMQTELGWSTPAITGAYSLALLVTMILSPPLGYWLDRSGPRVPMTLGSVLGTILLVAWARVESLPGFYLIWAGIGVAIALTLYEPAFAAASTWFVRGRSRALLVLTTVAGLASTIFLPVAGWLIERLGWRDALVVLAILLGVTTIPAHALVLRRRPEDLGFLADGEPAAPDQPSPPPQGVALSYALRDPAYWWLTSAFFLGMVAAVAIGVYLIPILLERGESLARATFITGLIGAAQVGGRVAITALERRVPEQALGTAVFALQAIALAVILITSGLALTLLAVALLGAGRGGITLMRATLVADRYGRANFATISGIPAAAQMAARAAAPVGAGLLVTWLGGYEPMLAVLVAIAIAATLAMVMFALSAQPLQIDVSVVSRKS